MSSLVNRNVALSQGRTSLRLEPEVWHALDEACRREGRSHGAMVEIAEAAYPTGSRTSAIRVYLFQYFRAAATEGGHAAAGHGAG